MLQKFKSIFPWILMILLGMVIFIQGQKIRVLKESKESIIDSLRSVKIKEESLVDSFSVVRILIQHKRDSSLEVIDTLGVSSLSELLRKNMEEYEKGNY